MTDIYDDMDTNEIPKMLRQWREANERKSEDVLTIWHLYQGKFPLNGNEKYIVYEQVFYAAIDCHDYEAAEFILIILQEQFGAISMRIWRHRIALLEAQDQTAVALEHLEKIIATDPTNAALRKRRVAIYKAEGRYGQAVQALVTYLKSFMSDAEAWQELCNLYLELQEYSRAAFCAEELILHQPHNHLAHQRLADIRYTMGGVENMELAKAYYCQALKLNPENMRALLGLFLVTNNLLTHYKSSGNSGKRKEVWRLGQWAQTQASRRQKAASDGQLTSMMLALAIAD